MADIINFLDHRKNSKYGRNPLEPRLPLDPGILSTKLTFDNDLEIKGEVVDISAGGIALLLDSEMDLERGALIEKITLTSTTGDIFEASGHIAHITPEIKDKDFSHRLGLGFKRKETPTLDALNISKQDRSFDIIKEDAQMIQIMEDLILIGDNAKMGIKLDSYTSIEGQFRRSSQLKKVTSFAIDFDSEEHCMNFEIDREFTIFFNLFASFYIFRTKVLQNTGKSIEISIPEFFVKLMRRQTSRVPKKDLGGATVTINNPFSSGKPLTKELEDMNEEGFSILVDKGEFVFPVGTSLHEMKLNFPGTDKPLSTFGNLVHIEPFQDEDTYKCGIKFYEDDIEKTRTLENFAFYKRFPLLSPSAKEDYPGTWELFENSGYLDEKPRESFELVREYSNPTWEKLDSSDGLLTRNLAATDGERITGGMHLTRVYKDTFLLHHFCILPGHQRTATTSVYGGMIDNLLESGAKYIACYYNADKAWNDKNYGEFIKTYPYKEENYNKIYDLFEFDLTKQKMPQIEETSFSINEANDFDIKGISRFFSMTRKDIQIEAMDLSPETINLDQIGENYSKAGLERSRKFFTAKRGKEIIGFSMLDITSTGVNIYALMDSFRVYTLNKDEKDKEAIIKALTIASLGYFKSIGKKTVLYYSNDKDISFLAPIKFQRLCSIVLWIAHRNCFARYREYNGALFGRIMARRQAIRNKNKNKEENTRQS